MRKKIIIHSEVNYSHIPNELQKNIRRKYPKHVFEDRRFKKPKYKDDYNY